MEAFYDYLLKKYGKNVPIFFDDVSFENYSRPWVSSQLAALCKCGKLKRFQKGVYYIPSETIFGPSVLNPRDVIERKYIKRNGAVIGFYAGATLINNLGLSTQMPNGVEIFTNAVSSRSRIVSVGGQQVVLKRPPARVTSKNVSTMMLFEVLDALPPNALSQERRDALRKFIKANGVTKENISQLCGFFPDKPIRTLVESGVIYDAT